MNNNLKYLWVLVAVAAVALVVYFSMNKTAPKTEVAETPNSGNSSMMRMGANAIYVADQKPGNKVMVNSLVLEKAGFVAIHASSQGKPGAIIGTSALLTGAENTKVEVNLTRVVADSEELMAMLHLDNGDGKFDASTDSPAKDSMGNAVMMIFHIDTNADSDVEVNL